MHKRAFPLSEFCSLYAVGRTTAYGEISSGRLRVVKLGRRTLVTEDDAEAWLAALPASASKSEGSPADELPKTVGGVAILTIPADCKLTREPVVRKCQTASMRKPKSKNSAADLCDGRATKKCAKP